MITILIGVEVMLMTRFSMEVTMEGITEASIRDFTVHFTALSTTTADTEAYFHIILPIGIMAANTYLPRLEDGRDIVHSQVITVHFLTQEKALIPHHQAQVLQGEQKVQLRQPLLPAQDGQIIVPHGRVLHQHLEQIL